MLWVQRMTFFLGRMIFWMLLLPVLVGLVLTLSYEHYTAALVFLVLTVIILYIGLVRIRIPANSLVLRDGKVVFFIPEKTVRDRFDFASRGQTIVQLPVFNLLDRPYKLEFYFPDPKGGLNCCRLSLTLGYIMDETGWQRAYDHFVVLQDRMSLEVKRQLFRSAAQLALPRPPQGEEGMEGYLKPIVAELNGALQNMGLKIKDASCTFTAGSTLVRFVAGEQEIVEKAVVPVGAARDETPPAQETPGISKREAEH
jgi:hypothetical protein